MSSRPSMLRLLQHFVAHDMAMDDASQTWIFGSLSRPPERSLSFLSWRKVNGLVCTCSHPQLSRNIESGTMISVDGVEFGIDLASMCVHRQGEFCLRSIEHTYECDIVRRAFKLFDDGCCVFVHLKSLKSEAAAMLLIQFGGLRVIILFPHLFDGFYATVIPEKILISSLHSLDQVKHSAIIAQKIFQQSQLLATMDQLVIWFIKFLPRLKKETSFFSCWVLYNERDALPDSVYGVVSRELLLILWASVLFQEEFDISYKPATLQFTLLSFVLDSLDEHQMLQQIQSSIQLLQIQEVMLHGNANVECVSPREFVVRLSTLSVFRHLPMLLVLPYGSSPRPPDDHTSAIHSAIHPSNSNEGLKI